MKLRTATCSVLLLAILLTIPVEGQEVKPITEIEILNRLDRNDDGFLQPGENIIAQGKRNDEVGKRHPG